MGVRAPTFDGDDQLRDDGQHLVRPGVQHVVDPLQRRTESSISPRSAGLGPAAAGRACHLRPSFSLRSTHLFSQKGVWLLLLPQPVEEDRQVVVEIQLGGEHNRLVAVVQLPGAGEA